MLLRVWFVNRFVNSRVRGRRYQGYLSLQSGCDGTADCRSRIQVVKEPEFARLHGEHHLTGQPSSDTNQRNGAQVGVTQPQEPSRAVQSGGHDAKFFVLERFLAWFAARY